MRIIVLTLALLPAIAWSAPAVVPPDQAFRYSVAAGGAELTVDWRILPGYYMYRHRFGFASRTDGIVLGEPELPAGKKKTDEFFGETEVYRDAVRVRIPFQRQPGAASTLTLELRSQGCADVGLCYPPQTWTHEVALPTAAAGSGAPPVDLLALIGTGNAAADGQFLPPEEAFAFTATTADPYTLQIDFRIAEGYYLYRDKFSFQTDSELVQLGPARLAPGVPKVDEHFGATEVYYHAARLFVPLSRAGPEAGDFEVVIGFQGCAEDGICYPPMTRETAVILPTAVGPAPSELAAPVAEQDRLASLIRDGKLGLVALSFFGLGLLLAFTPCVFPMVPILSGIIVGQGPDITPGRAFVLSAVYVLAMALTYTVAGIFAAALGQNLQAMFQHPGVIIAFSLIFVALSLAMFGVYELQVPAGLQARLSEFSNRQRGGTLLGVGVMGVLSALIVGPCVAAPLAAALIVLGQSGDPVRGGVALFTLSLGMGAPLLVFGASAGHLLPRAGSWMTIIRGAFGVLLLGMAIWFLSRIVPEMVTMLLWATLILMTGIFLGAFQSLGEHPGARRQIAKGLGIIAVVYGVVLVVAAALGGTDPLRPLHNTSLMATSSDRGGLEFDRIKTVDELTEAVRRASADGHPTMLDFYADWCVECKKLEKTTFHDPDVIDALGDTVLLQADVTANDEADRKLLNHFGIYGPPTIVFFGRDGFEMKNYRVIGYMNARDFETTARAVVGSPRP